MAAYLAARHAATIIVAGMLVAVAMPDPTSRAATALDYDFFKTRVQAIFLEKRPTHTRCYTCHENSNNAFRLEPLSQGATAWSEEQSRKNFEMASKLVNPGDPGHSRLLMQPLAPRAAAMCFTPAAGSSRPRTIRAGRRWRTG